MKKYAQKFVAYLLVLCTVLSVMPAAVFAVADTLTVSQPVVYDFTGVADINATSLPGTESPVTKELYENGSLNWTYIGRDSNQSNTMVGGTSTNGQTVRNWDGLRLNSKKANGWIAIKIQSPGTGLYDIQVGYQTYKNYGTADIYVMPADADISSGIANGVAAGSVSSYSANSAYEDASVKLQNAVSFTAGEEYIVAFHFPNPNDENIYTCVTSLSMTPAEDQDESLPQSFDFTSVSEINGTSLALSGSAATNTLYNAGTLNWTYIGRDSTQSNVMVGGTSADGQTVRAWQGLRLNAKKANGWNAVKIKSSATGTYTVKFGYQTYNKHAAVDVYILPGDTADVAAALTNAQKVGSVNSYSATSTYQDAAVTFTGTFEFAADEEYLVVFYYPNPEEANLYTTITGLSLIPYEGSPEETTGPADTTAPEETTVPEETESPVAPGQRDEVIYDFDLGATNLKLSGETFATKPLASASIAAIAKYYTDYQLDWKYVGVSSDLKEAANFGGRDGDKNYLWNGLRYYTKNAENKENKAPYYAAFEIRSPGTGKYYLTFDYQTHRYGASKGSVYILPGDTTDIAAAIKAGKALTTVNYDNRSASGATAAESASTIVRTPVDFVLDETYLLVFTAEEAGKAGYLYLYLDQVTLTHENVMPPLPEEPKPPQLDKAEYDFDLGNSALKNNGQTLATQNLGNAGIQSAVDTHYLSGKLNWTYHSQTKDSYLAAVFGGKSGEKDYIWDGLRIYAKDKQSDEMLRDYYVAFTIQSPGTGNYRMTVDYMVARYGAKKGSIYVLPGSTKDVDAAIKSGKAVGSLNFDNGATNSTTIDAARTTFSSNVAFKAGEEYIIVFRSHLVGRADSYMYLTKLTLTKSGLKTPADIIPERVPEPEPIPEGSTVYDLDLADGVTGVLKGQGALPFLDTLDEINALYKNGTLNWNYNSHYCLSDTSAGFKTGGLTLYSYEMEWVAIKIKSPGKGLHTLTINHAVSGNGAIGAVYVLPADTTDVEKAMDPSNRVGKLSYANEDGTAAMVDGKRSVVGTWEFGDAKEYIIVFEAYQHSPFVVQRGYMYISQLIITPGDLTKAGTGNRKINSIVIEEGPVKICESTLYGTTANIDGSAYLFVPIEGKKLLAYNLSDGILEKEIKIPFTITRGMLTDRDGNLWMVGDKPYIFRYDPITGVGEQFASYKTNSLAPGATSGFDLVEDEEGYLYFGTYNTGAILKFDPTAGEYTYLCTPNSDAVYPVGMAVKDGYLYCGVYGDKNADGKRVAEAVKVDTKTGKIVARVDLEAVTDKGITMYRGAGLAGELFLLGSDGVQKKPIAIDINTMELVDVNIQGGILYGVTEELNGKVYFVVNGKGVHEMDVKTYEVRQVPGLDSVNFGVRCGKDNFVDVGDPVYPGMSIATYSTADAMPRIYNLESGNVRVWSDLLSPDFGNPTTIRPIVSGLPGSNELIIGAYNSNVCSVFNTEKGKITHTFEATAAQTDAFVWYEGVLYTGNYNACNLTRINFEDPDRNVIMMSLKNEYKQSRIHTMTAGGGKVFIGTTPDRYEYGGCLAWVDVNTLERHIERNVVQDQTINCIVYHNGYIYGTTSVSGGSGTGERPDLSAKLFVYDVENKKKVAEADLADYIPGLRTPIDWIYGIAADPKVDENGRFWGLVSETLFSFSFDKETGKISVKEELSFDKQTYSLGSGRNWFPRPFVFDDAGYLYLAFEGNGGMRKINTNNVKDNTRIMDITPMFYALGEDGNIYYVQDQSLMMYPLNVTEEDWKIAENMDAVLLQLDPNVTLESEAAIKEVRAAYDALSWKHKALVQNAELLEFAEIDLLECKIDAIGEISVDSKDMIYDLLAQYEALPERYQRYVKNAEALQEAYRAVNALLDQIEADRVQKMIDSIKDMGKITLEHEQEIRRIREAYEALTTMQKAYVDITLLLQAEAEIKTLRQVRIDRLIQLIAKIGDPVTLADEPVITEAMEIYEWMHIEERGQVDYEKLVAASNQLKKLQKAAAKEVDALIEAIGDEITKDSGDAIRAAREAYDALTPGSKAYVTMLSYLEQAEQLYAEIGSPVLLIVIIGAATLAAGVTAALLIRKRKKAKTN